MGRFLAPLVLGFGLGRCVAGFYHDRRGTPGYIGSPRKLYWGPTKCSISTCRVSRSTFTHLGPGRGDTPPHAVYSASGHLFVARWEVGLWTSASFTFSLSSFSTDSLPFLLLA